MKNTIIQSNVLIALRELPSDSINCCVTSPPYYKLRDYEIDEQIGMENTPEEYIARLVEVFHEVRRVLRSEGTLWLVISDSYCNRSRNTGCKQKDLLGIPWLAAFALRNDGWYLRNDIIWCKKNAIPESVRDRCTRTYEHIFLLAKSKKYYFDAAAIAEPVAESTKARLKRGRGPNNKYSNGVPGQPKQGLHKVRLAGSLTDEQIPTMRNKRDIWHINNTPYKGNHFATFPIKLAETCILAGCPIDGIVLDCFFGAGSTGVAAKRLGRNYVGIEINPDYCRLAHERIENDK